MKYIYMAHPVGAPYPAGVSANLARARRWYRWCVDQGVSVSAGWIIDCELYDDADPVHREAGMLRSCEAVRRCDELWLVGGRISKGMVREAETATNSEIRVRDLTKFGDEPPALSIRCSTCGQPMEVRVWSADEGRGVLACHTQWCPELGHHSRAA